MYLIFSSALNMGIPGLAKAQISLGGSPKSFGLKLKATVPVVNLPTLDKAALQSEDEQEDQTNSPLRFAVPVAVNLNLKNAGVWTDLPNGDRIWRLKIHAPGAVSLNFLYDNFHLPRGGLFYIYNPEQTETLGAFAAHNNKAHGKFATALLHDDTAILEYYEPKEMRGQSTLSIRQVGHGYRSIDELVPGQQKNSGDCQVDVGCSPEGDQWQEVKNSVTRIIMDGAFICTGTLMNNTSQDQTPYVLSSNHCLAFGNYDAVTKPDIGNFVFYWNYERSACGSDEAMPINTTVGATIIANSEESGIAGSDFALYRLDENPTHFFDVHFAGFDASGAAGVASTCIHHPMGDSKKIATSSQAPISLVNARYWQVYWEQTPNGHSITEAGSSGSALFNDNQQVIGQLYGGSSVNCADPFNDWAVFGQLAHAWDNNGADDNRRRLRDWLDPTGLGENTTMDGVNGLSYLVEDCSHLFISEYTEGSGLNRCIEIFNPNEEAIDMASGAHQVRFYFEGNTDPGTIINLTDTIPAYGTYVICDDGADSTLLEKADLIAYATFFNGDDAIELLTGNIPLDCFGRIGQDPGNAWGAGSTSTRNNTLRRKTGILMGDRDPADQFDPAEEWEGFPLNDFRDLGSFDCDCQSKCPLPSSLEFSTCTNEVITLDVNLEEGTLEGPGLEGNLFNPRAAGPGAHELIYRTDSDTCVTTVSIQDLTPPTLVGRQYTIYYSGSDMILQDTDVLDMELSADDCGQLYIVSYTPAVLTCEHIGQTVVVNILAEDDAGNEAQGTALITVAGTQQLPPSWSHTDIGNSAPAGSILGNQCQASNSIQIQSNTIDNDYSGDDLHFVYQNLCDDGSLEVEITDLQGSGYAGVMFRESLDAGSRMIALYTRFSSFIYEKNRLTPDGATQIRSIFRPGVKWLKLERSGNLITGYCSSNGNYWQIAFSRFVSFNSCLEVGIFAQSRSTEEQCVATFENLSLNTIGALGAPGIPIFSGVLPSDNRLEVYPNPVRDELSVRFTPDQSTSETGQIEIHNAQGQLVIEKPVALSTINQQTIAVNQLNTGMYFLTVKSEETQQTIRFIKH